MSEAPQVDRSEKGEVKESKEVLDSSSSIPKAVIKNADMEEELQQAVVDIAHEAMAKFSVEKDIAAHVKRTMDEKHGPTWHAVVGKNYGSYVTHETKHFIYFYLGQIAFLLWRA